VELRHSYKAESESLGGIHISKAARMSKAGVVIGLLAALAFMGGTTDITTSPAQCSDGIDNDGDGDYDGTELECFYTEPIDPNSTEPPQTTYCPNWDDETTPPTSLGQCS